MITGKLLHPGMLQALASAGHGAQIVIADSNYPFAIKSHPNTPKVYLNLAPGKLTVTDVLEVLVDTVPIEAARAIDPEDGTEPAIFDEYRAILPDDVELGKLGRFPFYEAAQSPDTALMIATGEQRTWACIVLTIGVIEAK